VVAQRVQQRAPPVAREHDPRAAPVGDAFGTFDEPARGHARELVREPALLPAERLAERARTEPPVGRVEEREQHRVVGLRDARVALQAAVELAHEIAVHREEAAPERPVGLVDLGHHGHDASLPEIWLTCHLLGL